MYEGTGSKVRGTGGHSVFHLIVFCSLLKHIGIVLVISGNLAHNVACTVLSLTSLLLLNF